MRQSGVLLVPLLAAGCVTERIIERPAPHCDPVTGANCPLPARPLTDRERAELAFEDECGRNRVDSCVELGKLLTEDGNLDRAQIPLRKAYREDNGEAALALAQVYELRGDAMTAERMRWEALAIDKANSETTVWFRPGNPQGAQGLAFTVNLQPMAFFARRLNVGFEMAFAPVSPLNVSEIDFFAGYQHFFSEHVVGYGQAILGDMPQVTNGALNYGADIGLKLVIENIGGINIGFGATRASPIHLQIGITFNSIAWIIPLLLLGHR
jgi:hypothetical protein